MKDKYFYQHPPHCPQGVREPDDIDKWCMRIIICLIFAWIIFKVIIN